VGLESPIGPKIAGGTPTLGLGSDHSKLYNRHSWKKSPNEPNEFLSLVIKYLSTKKYEPNFSHIIQTPEDHRSLNRFAIPGTPTYGSVSSLEDFSSPPRNGPLGSGQVGSLNELYHSPIGAFNLDKNLVNYLKKFSCIFLFLSQQWSQEDRRYIKTAKPPPAPGTNPIGVMSVTGREIPNEFLQAVEYGRKHHNKALSTMKWKKTFISGNSATVYGIELNGENLILKITKHGQLGGSHSDEIPQCVDESDIKSLQESHDPCDHKPKNGLIRKPACSAEPNLGEIKKKHVLFFTKK
jgi:hypothetical protein